MNRFDESNEHTEQQDGGMVSQIVYSPVMDERLSDAVQRILAVGDPLQIVLFGSYVVILVQIVM
jgi:hypothetical protein